MKAHVEKWKKVGEKNGKPIYQPAIVSVVETHRVQFDDTSKDIKVKCSRKWDGKTDYEPSRPPSTEKIKEIVSA